jgi:hypothetical protein
VSWQVELIVPVAIGLRSKVLAGVGIRKHEVAVFDIGTGVFSPGNVSEFNQFLHAAAELIKILFARTTLPVFGCALEVSMAIMKIEFELDDRGARRVEKE